MRNITIISYSPDGMSRRLAESLAEQIDGKYCLLSLEQEEQRSRAHFFSPEDLLIFSAPSIQGRMPQVGGGLFQNIYANDSIGIFLTAYHPPSFGDALLEIAQTAEDRGVIGMAAAAFAVSHRINEKEQEKNDVKMFAASICDLLSRMADDNRFFEHYILNVNGQFPYRDSFTEEGSTQGVMHATEDIALPQSEFFYMQKRQDCVVRKRDSCYSN